MWLLPAILVLAGSALAQETPKVEISGSYSFLRFGTNQNGASFSVAGNVNSWFGVVGGFRLLPFFLPGNPGNRVGYKHRVEHGLVSLWPQVLYAFEP